MNDDYSHIVIQASHTGRFGEEKTRRIRAFSKGGREDRKLMGSSKGKIRAWHEAERHNIYDHVVRLPDLVDCGKATRQRLTCKFWSGGKRKTFLAIDKEDDGSQASHTGME